MMKLDISNQSPRKTPNGTSGPAKSQRGPPTRPLGTVRHSSDNVTKFPPLTGPAARLDASYTGITGSAMSVPPAKPVVERQLTERTSPAIEREKPVDTPVRRGSSPRKTVSSQGSATSDSSTSKKHEEALREKDREIQLAMGRERELKQLIMQLQKTIDELKQEIRDKDKTIEKLQEQIAKQEEFYKEQYEKECSRHRETQDFLQGVKTDLQKMTTAKALQAEEHEKKIEELNTTMNTRLQDLANEKDKEIKTRDEKLTKLKKQMAEALKGNSWERQQQLDELSKELTKVQEEAELLRMKIRSMSKNSNATGGGKGGSCANCDSMKSQVSASQGQVKDKDQEINKLKALCAKFEKQLSQQDVLIKQLAEAKGHKGK